MCRYWCCLVIRARQKTFRRSVEWQEVSLSAMDKSIIDVKIYENNERDTECKGICNVDDNINDLCIPLKEWLCHMISSN